MANNTGKSSRAYLYGLAVVLLWSMSATAFKLSLRLVDPVQLLFYSTFFSVLALAGVLACQGKLGLVFSYTKTQYLRSLGLGLLNPVIYYLMVFKAYDLLPAQEAQPLNYTWAIALALLSVPLLGHKLTKWDVLATLIGYSGVVVISTHGDPLSLEFSDPLGVALAMGCTVIWALYWIFNARDDRDPVAALLLNFLFGLPVLAVICAIFSDLWPTDPRAFWGALWIGCFELGFTFVLWLTALKKAPSASKLSNLIFIAPFISLFFIRFVVKENILPSTFVGLLMVVAGLGLQQLNGRGKG